jgi:hypothetical protein
MNMEEDDEEELFRLMSSQRYLPLKLKLKPPQRVQRRRKTRNTKNLNEKTSWRWRKHLIPNTYKSRQIKMKGDHSNDAYRQQMALEKLSRNTDKYDGSEDYANSSSSTASPSASPTSSASSSTRKRKRKSSSPNLSQKSSLSRRSKSPRGSSPMQGPKVGLSPTKNKI